MTKPDTRRYLVLAVVLCAAVVFLVVSLRGRPSEKVSRTAPRQTASASAATEAANLPAAAPADADYARYQMIVDRNVFGKVTPPPAVVRPVGSNDSLPPLRPSRPTSEPDRPERAPASTVSLDGWSYLGYIEVDGTLMGLLHNDADRSSESVKTGDEFRGLTVIEVTLDEIRLKSGRRESTLARVDSYPLLPLDNAATTTTAADRSARAANTPRPR